MAQDFPSIFRGDSTCEPIPVRILEFILRSSVAHEADALERSVQFVEPVEPLRHRLANAKSQVDVVFLRSGWLYHLPQRRSRTKEADEECP